MCGICGIARPPSGPPVDPAVLDRMTEIVRHRGPDDAGRHLAPGVGLGVRRLAIIDPATGQQPVSSEDGSVTVVCNGEIYNFERLRDELSAAGHRFRGGSDVEVIVHLYEEHGVDCLHRLRGMFAFALWDDRRRRLMLARDRLGIKPLHYAVDPDGLYFGSELKSILMVGAVGRDVDPGALHDLFTFGFVPDPRTLFARIRRLRAGHYLLYEDGALSVHRYWAPAFPDRAERHPRLRPGEWAEELRARLAQSVKLHLRSDVPVGAWLSPGVDSSSVVALMRRWAALPLPTFTLGFEDPEVDEAGTRATLAAFVGPDLAEHRVTCRRSDLERLPQALWHGEDPTTSGIEIARLILAEATAQRVRVVLTGEGADEVLGGYPWFRADRLLRPLAHLPETARRALLRGPLHPTRRPYLARVLLARPTMDLARYVTLLGFPPGMPDSVFSSDLRRTLAAGDGPEALPVPPSPSWHPFAQLQYHELSVRLPGFITPLLDRTSMAFGLEARVPFLDHELVEWCAHIPPALKLRGRREKHILREALRGVVPEAIRQRPKFGFRAPVQQWFRAKLPEFATELLGPDALRRTGYFQPEAVVAALDHHRAGRAGYGARLLGVLAVQLWDELFVRGCRPVPGS